MRSVADVGVDWLKSLARFGLKPGLNRVKAVLESFDRPDATLLFYHVAGTNGKGSVCAMLAALLGRRLQKVGMFVSPAFAGYRGRFSINGLDISSVDFARLALMVMDRSAAVLDGDSLTEFEALTLMAILYFYENRVDAVVWETGLGGRYDSTNVVHPVITGITNISYDHTEVLGPTLCDIAYEKAGIIKPDIPVVTAAKDAAYRVIERVAKEQNSPLFVSGRQFQVIRQQVGEKVQRIYYRGIFQDVAGLNLPLFGAHQCENAGVALAMYEAANQLCTCRRLLDPQIREAIASVGWPGRFEVFIKKGKVVILDGAHNPDGAKQFSQSLCEFSKIRGIDVKRWVMVVGVMSDKAIESMLGRVLPHAHTVIFTSPNTPRAASPQRLANIAKTMNLSVKIEQMSDVPAALKYALSLEYPIACWGSLYTVEEAREAITTLLTD